MKVCCSGCGRDTFAKEVITGKVVYCFSCLHGTPLNETKGRPQIPSEILEHQATEDNYSERSGPDNDWWLFGKIQSHSIVRDERGKITELRFVEAW